MRVDTQIATDEIVFYGITICITIILIISLYFVSLVNEKKELSLLHGRLYPANNPMPYNNPCKNLEKDDIVVFIGSKIAIAAKNFPLTVIPVKGYKGLIIEKNPMVLLHFP